jgi:ADP-ribose pyrophosphatase
MSEYQPPVRPEQTKKLWFDGPNYTADAVIINAVARRILLIQRKDTHQWALPGGFVDPDEQAIDAARREAEEETGAQLVGDARLIYKGVVDDPRNSNEAWIETSAFLFQTLNFFDLKPGDDAEDASWKNLSELPPLYASHQKIVSLALHHLND